PPSPRVAHAAPSLSSTFWAQAAALHLANRSGVALPPALKILPMAPSTHESFLIAHLILLAAHLLTIGCVSCCGTSALKTSKARASIFELTMAPTSRLLLAAIQEAPLARAFSQELLPMRESPKKPLRHLSKDARLPAMVRPLPAILL